MSRIYLIVWSFLYVLLWSLATIILDPTVPYDAIEALNWAQNFEWGSPKNPWLVGMVWRPALWLPTNLLSAYWYITHFTAIALGMVGSWFLAKYLTGNERLAWLALFTLNLSGIINFDIISYNDNYLLVMIWPWMMLFFFFAMTRNSIWWIPFAIAAGLATMAKYSTLAFVCAVFISTLIIPRLRFFYRRPNFYTSIIIYIFIISPNILWLIQHDYAAFNWVDSQIKTTFNPWVFTKLLSIYYPLLILWLMLRKSKIKYQLPVEEKVKFLLGVVFLPQVAIVLFFLFHHGGRLTEWLQPFFILAPAFFVTLIKVTGMQIERKTILILCGMAGIVFIGYVLVMLNNVSNAGRKMSGIVPFSIKLEQLWKERYETPLRFVGGEHLAEWLTFYAPSMPVIITPWNTSTKPNIYNANIKLNDIQSSGALLIGRPDKVCSMESFSRALKQWPQLHFDGIEQVDFNRDSGTVSNSVCIAFVKPKD